jgi:hypothetical protein
MSARPAPNVYVSDDCDGYAMMDAIKWVSA